MPVPEDPFHRIIRVKWGDEETEGELECWPVYPFGLGAGSFAYGIRRVFEEYSRLDILLPAENGEPHGDTLFWWVQNGSNDPVFLGWDPTEYGWFEGATQCTMPEGTIIYGAIGDP